MPPTIWGVALGAVLLAIFAAANLVYHVIRKPTELLYPLAHVLDKSPTATWREYGDLFREYATANVSAELLAALAQSEGAGNPVAHTYWRWRLTWRPLEVYQPASSAAGMYQMTDAAFAEASRYCIRGHAVVADGCGVNGAYMRVVPSNAVELASIYLDRNVAAILSRLRKTPVTAPQKQDLAVVVHLCGPGPAAAFARRGFHLAAGESCGDHDAEAYLARVRLMALRFAQIAGQR